MKLAEPAGTEGKPTIKKVKHSCATKVEHSEWGKGNCLKEMHSLDEQGNVSHYDVMFEHGLEQNVPVQSLNVLEEGMHEHVINPDKNVIDEKTTLDPVGKDDGDVDNDGDKDSSDSYLMNRRRAVAKAMGKKMKKEETEELEEKKGLYANIHAKRKRGEAPAKPGDEDYPAKDAFKKAAKTAKKEEVEVQEGSMKQARKNVGASTCWDGYEAKGTKKKNGKTVPNCVKKENTFADWRKELSEKK